MTPYPNEAAITEWKPFPERLNLVPARVSSGSVPGVTSETFEQDNKTWKKHVSAYKRINKILDSGRYRNIMDMNAGLGSFAAALDNPKLWVMNVVPTIAELSTLGAIAERGLIGIYHDWYVTNTSLLITTDIHSFHYNFRLFSFPSIRCEAFSTYPRTYDLIHANRLFSLYKNK